MTEKTEARSRRADYRGALFGGRPMTREQYAFTDIVSGNGVWYWRDSLGRRWMAEGRWSLFRLAALDSPEVTE